MPTYCIVCNQLLIDPQSIAEGIGPVCREKAIMSNDLNEVIKHLPGQHTQQSHGRRAAGGAGAAQDALNVGGNPTPEIPPYGPGNKITFYRKGGRRPGTVASVRPDGRLNVVGEDGKKYTVDPNRKRTKVQFVDKEPSSSISTKKKPEKKPAIQQKPEPVKTKPKPEKPAGMPKSHLADRDIQRLKDLENADYQSRTTKDWSFPESNIPTDITVWGDGVAGNLKKGTNFVGVEAMFKNTTEKMAEQWLRGRMNAELGPAKAKKGTYTVMQAGDYHDDWVSATVEFNRHQLDWVNKNTRGSAPWEQ